jgi:Fe-Mn family superoxide dismutase
MAHNNHFFFKRLSPNPVAMPETLRGALEQSFSSVETLRQEFIATASAMFGPGFVWLVKLHGRDAPGQIHPFRLLTTYLAGSPYPGAHWRRQAVDRNTAAPGPITPADSSSARAPGGVDVVPVLCLNTWEHVWLRDYGLGVGGHGGKRQFVEEWWKSIDWEGVATDANLTRPPYMR